MEFRRALLNKCQDEFQEGVVAMKAVAERELRSKDGAAPDEEVRASTYIMVCCRDESMK